jgi:8-oxo-dGTP pyrophosphatase MutT (NUDIX family)
VRSREAVRAVLVDPAGAVLLMRVVEPGSQQLWWVAPGGGIDGDESHVAALCRELAEELGHEIAEDQVGPAVWHRDVVFSWNHEPIRQHETYYLVETERFDPAHCQEGDASTGWYTALARWWTAAELEATTDNVAPFSLPALVADLYSAGPPATVRLVD